MHIGDLEPRESCTEIYGFSEEGREGVCDVNILMSWFFLYANNLNSKHNELT